MVAMGYERNTAEEVVQETMIQLFRNWEEVENPRAWSRKVALRLAQKEKMRRARDVPVVDDVLIASSKGFEDRIDLYNAIQSLPERQRQVVVLYYLDDLTLDTVAELLGTSRSAVRRILERARDSLKDKLGI
jgi:RNA polymerase sigma-70 factor (ECF subfamily)